ncbi:MAG TPA: hypothetical protein VHC69_13080 [Polyangiaceae bacterium]|nr:hypothetical protein [Polyangiaceae bacterium]
MRLAVAAALLVVTSCGRAEPSRTPLSPAVARADGRVRPSSSRALEGSEETEERNEVEIVVTPSDDDGDDSTKPAPDCATLAPASNCLGASVARRACEELGPAVEPRAFAGWMSCMQDPASGSPCDSHRVVACGLRAVGNAGVDGTYHAFCEHVATECSDVAEQITTKVCEQLIATWKPERRSQMLECLKHGCETGAFGGCLP